MSRIKKDDAVARAAKGSAREAIGKLIGDDAEARRGRDEKVSAERDCAAAQDKKEEQ